MIGILEKDIVRVTLLVTPQKLYQILINSIPLGQLLERIDFILVIAVCGLGVVSLEYISVGWLKFVSPV